ncbi:hypothetical protein As57867_015176, partial [Aphanomyces stellatus]
MAVAKFRACVVAFAACWLAHAQIRVFPEVDFKGTPSTLANGTVENNFQGPIGSATGFGTFLAGTSLALRIYSKPNLEGVATVVMRDMADLSSLTVGSISVTEANWNFTVVNLFAEPNQAWPHRLKGPFVQYTVGDSVEDFQGRIRFVEMHAAAISIATLVAFTGVNFTGTRTIISSNRHVLSVVRSFQIVKYDSEFQPVELFEAITSDIPVAQLLVGESMTQWNAPYIGRIKVPNGLVVVFYEGVFFTGNKTFVFSSQRSNFYTLRIGSVQVVPYNGSMDRVEIFPFANFDGPPLQFTTGDKIADFDGSIGSIKIPALHAMMVYQGKHFLGANVLLTQARLADFAADAPFQVQSFQIQSTAPPAVHLYGAPGCSGLPAKTLYLHDKQAAVDESFKCLHVHADFTLVMYSRANFEGNRSFVWSAWRQLPVNIRETMASYVVIHKANVTSFVRAAASSPDAIVWTSQTYSTSALEIRAFDGIAPGENRTNFVGFSAPNYFPPIDHVDIPPGVLVQAFYRPDFKGSWRLLTESGTYTFVRSFRVYRTDDDVTPIGNDDEPVVAFLKYGRSDWTLCVPAGQNAASQIVFAMSMTRRGFDTIDVPVGLALVAYSGTHFHGQRRVIPSGVYTDEYATDVLNWMQSLRVVQASNVLAVQTETTSGPGVRGHFTSKACSNANMTFVLDQEYMVLPKLDWTTLYIPDGLALVAYDRPWLLGRYSVWTNSVVQSPRSLGAKFRSVKVVLASEAPPVQLDPLPPSITGGTFGKTYVGE